jgi:hypothetical protein
MLAQRRGQEENTRKKGGCEMCLETKDVGNGEVVGLGLRPFKVPGILVTSPPDLPLTTPPLAVCNYVFYFPIEPRRT